MTVHAAGPRGWSEADLVLPAECPLGALLPSMVEAVVGAAPPQPLGWYASRMAGDRLDSALTLRESGVTDGALILLSTSRPAAPQRVHSDMGAAVVAAADQHDSDLVRVAPWIGLAVCLASASALAWSGASTPTATHLWVAGVLSAASAATAVVMRGSGTPAAEAAGLAAVAFAAAAAFLAVPRAPWPAALLLTASATLAVATSMLRTACRGSTALGSVVCATSGIAGVAALCAVTPPPVPAAGAALTVLALVAMSLAPKLTVTLAGIGPVRREIDESRAAAAHQVLTSLVSGLAGVAAIGATLTAVGAAVAPGSTVLSRATAVLFAADVGMLLLLRRRVHVNLWRRAALGLAGITGLAAAGGAAVVAAPAQAYWIAGVAGAAGLGAVAAQRLGTVTNPVLRQAIQALEYLLLAAVVPLAAWLSGVYGLARDLSLP